MRSTPQRDNPARPVGTQRPSGEDDAETIERGDAPDNQAPGDGEAAKTEGGKGSGKAANKL